MSEEVYFSANLQELPVVWELEYLLQGRPNRPGGPAKLPLILRGFWTGLPNKGLVLHLSGSELPQDTTLLGEGLNTDLSSPDDLLFFPINSTLYLEFEGQIYALFTVQSVTDDGITGEVYFTYPPGNLVFSENQYLESTLVGLPSLNNVPDQEVEATPASERAGAGM